MPNPSLDISQLRVPPHSIEAEYSVLGGLLLDNSVLDRIGDLLTDSDFYRFEHRLIYGACRALISEGRPADVVTVYEELSRKGSADEVGGIACLNSLAQYVPSAANTHRYAEIVRECAVVRKLITAIDEIAADAFDRGGRSVDDLLQEAESRIFKIRDEGPRVQQEFQPMETLVVGVSAHSLYKSHGGWRNAGPRAAFNKPHWPGRWKIGRLLHF